MNENADFVSTIRLKLDSMNLLRDAKAQYNQALKDANTFEQRMAAVMARLNEVGVQASFNPFADAQEQFAAVRDQVREIGRDARQTIKEIREGYAREMVRATAAIREQYRGRIEAAPTAGNARDLRTERDQEIAAARARLAGRRAEAVEAARFDFSKALAQLKEMGAILDANATASERMEQSARDIAAFQAAANRQSRGEGGGAGPDVDRTIRRLTELRLLIRELSDGHIDIDVRNPDLSTFARIGDALDALQDKAKLIQLGIDPNDAAAAVARIQQMNNALRDTTRSVAVASGQTDAYTKAWARNERAALLAGRTAQQNLAKTTLASQSAIRIIQDAPFGMMGIANNIQQLSEEFSRLREDQLAAARAAGVAAPSVLSSWGGVARGMLTGPMALPLALTLVTTLILSWDKLGGVIGRVGEAFTGTTAKVRAAAEDVNKELETYTDLLTMGGRGDLVRQMHEQNIDRLIDTRQEWGRVVAEYARGSEGIALSVSDNMTTARMAFVRFEAGAAAIIAALGSPFTALGNAILGVEQPVKTVEDRINALSAIAAGRVPRGLGAMENSLKMATAVSKAAGEAMAEYQAQLEAFSTRTPQEQLRILQIQLQNLTREFTSGLYQIETQIIAARAAGDTARERSLMGAQAGLQQAEQIQRIISQRATELQIAADATGARMTRAQALTAAENEAGVRQAISRIRERGSAERGEQQRQWNESDAAEATRNARRKARDERAADAAARRAEALRGKLAEMYEKAQQASDDALTRIAEDGIATRLAAIEADAGRRRNALSDISRMVYDAAGNVKRGMGELADAYAEAMARINRAEEMQTFREEFKGAMWAAGVALGDFRVQVETDAAVIDGALAGFTNNPVETARRAVVSAIAAQVRQTRTMRAEIAALQEEIAAFESYETRTGNKLSVEQEAEVATRQLRLAQLNAQGARDAAQATTNRRAAEIALTEAIRDQSRALEDRARALRDFRTETEEMTRVRTENVEPGGLLGWIASLGSGAENTYAQTLADIYAGVRAETDAETARFVDAQRTMTDAITAAENERAAVAARFARGEATYAQMTAADLAVIGLQNEKEQAEKAHQARLTEIQKTAAAERTKAEMEARRAQMQMAIGVLSSFSEASQSLYSTWAESRNRQLEEEGVAEEERSEILKREGRRRFMVMKGLRVAEAIANTISGGVAAWRAGMASGLPAPFNAILAGTMLAGALATGYAQVRQLRALTPEGGGGGGGSTGGGLGSYSALSGTITAERVAAFEASAGTLSPAARSNSIDSAAEKMQDAASRFEHTAANLVAVTTPATAEENFRVAEKRAVSLNR